MTFANDVKQMNLKQNIHTLKHALTQWNKWKMTLLRKITVLKHLHLTNLFTH